MIANRFSLLKISSLALIFAAAAIAQATPATYQVAGNGSGVFDNQGFSNVDFTITATADTSNIVDHGNGIFTVIDSTVLVEVIGFGTDLVTDQVQTVDNQPNSLAGFGDNSTNEFIAGANSSVFSSYDLTSNIGPISGGSTFNPGSQFQMVLGTFELDSINSISFQAMVTPEPSSFLGLGLGAAALLIRRRRTTSARK